MPKTSLPNSYAGHSYSTVLVHAEPSEDCAGRLAVAADLARQFSAKLIGLGAESFDTPFPVGSAGISDTGWVGELDKLLKQDLAHAEALFRRHTQGLDAEWIVLDAPPNIAIEKSAYLADLIVVGSRSSRSQQQAADPSNVILQAGCPVLLVPNDRSELWAHAIVVAWRNTRECRRAVVDALPLLQQALSVIVLAIVPPEGRDSAIVETDNVANRLRQRGVKAEPLVSAIGHTEVEMEIKRVTDLSGADLVVAGAYGHSRLQEWIFGGVTRSFLTHPAYFVLTSH